MVSPNGNPTQPVAPALSAPVVNPVATNTPSPLLPAGNPVPAPVTDQIKRKGDVPSVPPAKKSRS
jgi:hypothetical protein